ncbi:protein TBRG4 [Zootermopsis nevadensis]|uniref:Protein TBRG4 n=1 Tax=Zootermopsis nevadensis TaxID=136037 RepID=A0A067QJ37_ZOONE|nr:protein TBRG4 [Zootermopsis nevadensis]KDR07530.1 Protein TBRG4 [Zootermopsis nevadensis]
MMIRYVPWKGWRVLFRISNPMQPSSSSAPATVGLRLTPCSESTTKVVGTSVDVSSTVVSAPEDQTHDTSTSESKSVHVVNERKSSIVAAAFASLKRVEVPKKSTQSLHESISAADSVESLLSIAESPLVSRRHALQIVSQLADWTASGHVKLSDFETDTRFLKLCRLLGRGLPHGSPTLWKEASGNGDLAVVLGVTGEDKAAKLVAGISLSQMIRIMSSLAQKQRRSTPLLRSLAFNLARQREKFNIKDCADLLYAMATLNFPDDLLLEKTCGDLCECVESNHRPAVIGSILTSLGLLRYKNTEVLDALVDWVVCHVDVCRPHDLTALLLTLATVFHTPSNADHLFNVILPHVTVQDLPSPSAWLDVVWSLVVLEQAATQHVASVLDPNFCIKLSVDTDGKMRMNVASKLKLLNINAAAQLKIPGYKGPLLPSDSDVHSVPLTRSREKQLLVASILDSFSNLLPSATYLRSNIDTGMGFLLDGECMLDSNCNPLPVPVESTMSRNFGSEKMPASSFDKTPVSPSRVRGSRCATNKGTRIGILARDYRDMCRGSPEPNGVAALSAKLLECAGYRVLCVPHTKYNPREKLLQRVQYLDQHLKSLVRGP